MIYYEKRSWGSKNIELNNKNFVSIVCSVLVLVGIIITPNVFAENVPDWVKNTAGWWATDAISETEFVNAIEYLVKEDVIRVNVSQTSETSQSVPDWVKNTAGWWADNEISDDDFVNSIQYLIRVGIIIIPQTENVLTNLSTGKSSESILDTTSFFEVVVDYVQTLHLVEHDERAEFFDLNSEGFRGPEFSKDKPDNTYRIITVGGSTTFGSGVTDENTWPRILEKKLQNLSISKNIEVVNTSSMYQHNPKQVVDFSSCSSGGCFDSKLIKEKLIHYTPDLVIVYSGIDDVSCTMPVQLTKDHLESKELKIRACGVYSPDNYEKIYAERWSEICKLGGKNGFETAFILQPIVHFDKILTDQEFHNYFLRPEHTAYLDSLELFAQQLDSIEKHCTAAADFRGIFDYYLEPLYFDSVHVEDRGNEILAGKILELISPTLHEKGITKQISVQPNAIKPSQDPEIVLQLYEANWGKLLPSQKSFIGQNLSEKDFSNSNLENKIFFGSDLSGANFENSILTGSDFSLANLENANFKNAVIDRIKLQQTTLDQTNFSNVDFSQVNLMNVDLTNAVLKNSNLSNQDLTKTFLYKSDLSGADLSMSDLSLVYLKDVNLNDANLFGSILYEVDLSLASNKYWFDTILTRASMTWADLTAVDFSGMDLTLSNFYGSDLTDQDFTNDVTLFANSFQETKLTNANFEGADLFSDDVFDTLAKNKASLAVITDDYALMAELFGEDHQLMLIDKEIQGNDLLVRYIAFTNFKDANLENANFKNADLKFANFYQANLSNADLSGADLRKAFLGDADLSNANLDGAILDGAVLTCKNHSICN